MSHPMRGTRLLLLVALTACHHGPRQVTTLSPAALLVQARRQFHAGDMNKALQSYRRLQFELAPNDSTLGEAHYYVAEAEFQLGQLVEAAHDFRETADQFSQSSYAPTALLRAGDAQLRMWRNPELDPSYGQSALATYQELAGRYPGTDATARAQVHVRQLREWFADKDYKNGMFYFRRGAYDSGIIYFKDVLANYPETPRAVDALLRLADSYRIIGYKEERQEACAHLRQFYPQAQNVERSCPQALPSAGTTP
jgi:outer membrane protein assembly factor BamD